MLDELRQRMLECTECPSLCQNRSRVVFGSGSESPRLMIVGEAPGENEDKGGLPFMGEAVGNLTESLSTLALSVANATSAIQSCVDHLTIATQTLKKSKLVAGDYFSKSSCSIQNSSSSLVVSQSPPLWAKNSRDP